MKKKSHFIFALLLLFVFHKVGYAQFDNAANNLAPSANATSILKQTNTPVNMFAGLPIIQADIGGIRARGGFSIPVSLAYKSGGIKVQDVAGVVGLGWSLNVTCLIGRLVRGLPDEDPNGYFGSDMGQKIEGVLNESTLNGIRNGNLDAEPDLFFYNINGASGKFVFDKNKKAIFLNDKSIRVINSPFLKELGFDFWILADLYGNHFYFGVDQSCIEQTTSIAYGQETSKVQTYTSAWYMKKIVLANNSETIDYNYDSGMPTKTTYYRRMKRSTDKYVYTMVDEVKFLGIRLKKSKITSDMEVVDNKEWDNNIEQNTLSPKYLKSIVSSDECVFFSYDTVNLRKDLTNGLLLNKVSFRSYKGEVLRDFFLNYNYVFSNDPDQKEEISTDKPDKYRLLLSNIQYSENSSSTRSQKFTFQYHAENNLPPRYSRRIDHWGYFNNNNYGYFPEDQYSVSESKRPDPYRAMANSLRKIIYESGGYKEFIFEGNEFYDSKQFQNTTVGGIRLSKAITSDGTNSVNVIERYNYNDKEKKSTGQLINSTPVYKTFITNSHTFAANQQRVYIPTSSASGNPVVISSIPGFYDDFTGINSHLYPNFAPYAPVNNSLVGLLVGTVSTIIKLFKSATVEVSYGPTLITSFSNINNLFDVDGSAIGYSQISVDKNRDVKTIYKFTNVSEYPDSSAQFSINNDFYITARLKPDEFPFTPTTSYAFARGKLIEKLTYDGNNKLLNRTFNKYEFNNDNIAVKGFKCETASINTFDGKYSSKGNGYFNIGYYNVIPKSILLKESIEESYEKDNSNPIKQLVKYSYNNDFPSLITSKNTQNSDTSNYSLIYKYILDKDQVVFNKQSELEAANALYNKGSFATMIEQTAKRDNEILTATRTGFKKWLVNNKELLLPETTYKGNNGLLEPKMVVKLYNSYGSILESAKNFDVTNVTKWGYKELYPILECTNAYSNEVFYENFEESNDPNSIVGTAHSGDKYFNGSYTVNFNVANTKNYRISYWYLLNSVWHYSGYIPYVGPTMILNKGNAVDDVIILPEDAQATITSYHPSIGVTSKTDTRGETVYYEYDSLQRIKYVKDGHTNILKSFEYHYHPPYFFNDEVSGLFIKNNCPEESDYTGETIRYRISANTFYSIISKEEANTLANNYLNANGQAYANINGRCIPESIKMDYKYAPQKDDVCNFGSESFDLEGIKGYQRVSNLNTPLNRMFLDEYLTYPVPTGYYVTSPGSQVPVSYSYIEDGYIMYDNTCGHTDPLKFYYSAINLGNEMYKANNLAVKWAFENTNVQSLSVGTVLISSPGNIQDGYYLRNNAIYTVVNSIITNVYYYPITPKIMLFKSMDIKSICQGTPNSLFYYSGSQVGVGTVLFQDEELMKRASPGYYFENQRIYIVVDHGEVFGIQSCQEIMEGEFLVHPPFPEEEEEADLLPMEVFYFKNRADICYTGPVNQAPPIIEFPLYTRRTSLEPEAILPWESEKLCYSDESMAFIVPDGYYTTGIRDPNHVGVKFYYIKNGSVLFSNWCDQVDPTL